ncbi:hypothetical protein HMPREF0650_0923 [Hoylesella buccalis ATCC 35310]|uniref:Uncharacterized protein n=1 Tax=Hoylesella buccalis ATCC 35310 TaxID=679190 RepID=D1W951_9BACT|nr:hypothetical protein HMPREF0650_0923 [Hoylesella buccalis ATCC 35310]
MFSIFIDVSFRMSIIFVIFAIAMQGGCQRVKSFFFALMSTVGCGHVDAAIMTQIKI